MTFVDSSQLTPGAPTMPPATPPLVTPAATTAGAVSPFGDLARPAAKVSPFGDAAVAPLDFKRLRGEQISTNVEDASTGKPLRYGGETNNFTAGLNDWVYGTVGYLPDAARNAINDAILGVNYVQGKRGKDLAQNMVADDNFLGSKWWAKTFEQIGVHDPDKTIANSMSEKLSRLAGEGAGMVAAPELIMKGLTDAGLAKGQIATIMHSIVGEGKSAPSMIKNAGIGAVANATGGLAADQVPDEYKPLVHTLASLGGAVAGAGIAEGTAAAARGTAKTVAKVVAPLTTSGREALAGKELVGAATDPEAVKNALRGLEEIVPGSKQTTAAASGDMGLLAKERAVAAQHPEEFNQRRADQNQARVTAVADLQKTGSGEAVVSTLRDHLRAIDDQSTRELEAAHQAAEADVAAASQRAEQGAQQATEAARLASERVGQGAPADTAGDAIRQRLENARADAKTRERTVWQAVDPEGRLHLDASASKAEVAHLFSDVPATAKPAQGEEAAIRDTIAAMPDRVSLTDLSALQARVKAEMRAERMSSGESPTYARLSRVNSALQNDLENAVIAKAAADDKAVAAGQMRVEDTITAKLQREVDAWRARGETRSTGTDGLDAGPAGGASVVSSAPRGEVSGRPGDAGGPEGLPSNAGAQAVSEADLGDALGRLKTARATTKERVETFDNKTLGPIRKRPSTVSPYDIPAAAVPGRIFHSRPGSAEAIGKLRKAVGDEQALADLEPYAIERLRRVASREDGTIDPRKAETWLRNHEEALRSFPALAERVRAAAEASKEVTAEADRGKQAITEAEKKAKQTTADAAKKAKETKAAAEEGAIGKIVHAEDHEEVVRRVGAVFGRPDAARQMAALRRATHGDPEALAGLRRAVVDWVAKKFVSNTEVGTSEVGALKSDQFQTFVRDHKDTLKAAGFTDEEIARIERIAADLRLANRSVVAVKLPGGSNTAQDLWSTIKGHRRNLFGLLALPLLSEEGVRMLNGPVWGIAAGLAGALFAAARQAGLRKVDDLVKEAMLNPELALKLMEKVTPETATRQARGLIEALRPSNIVAVLSDTERPRSGLKAFMKDESGAGHLGTGTRKDLNETPAAGKMPGKKEPTNVDRGAGEAGVRREAESAATQSWRKGREEDGSLIGLPRKVGSIHASTFVEAQDVAQGYMKKAGLPYRPPTTYAKVDPERATRVASAYEAMKHDPQDPEVKAAYKAMADETLAQYQAILDSGMKFEFIPEGAEDPYAGNPRNMTEDVRNNHHMWVFPTKAGFGSDATFDVSDNPLLADTKFKLSGQTATVNDIFRGVHDYFGHVKEGVGFRADGEENAWRSHSSMYSPQARRAMTSETRGQNSWVNYGPHGEANRTAKSEDTHYADQKIGLMPEWVIHDGAGDELEHDDQQVAKKD